MLSTLSSFLPQLGGAPTSNQGPAIHEEPESVRQSEEQSPPPSQPTRRKASSTGVSEQGVLKKKSEKAHETFIVVRPPPAKNNHPLNLQVQLVPPTTTRDQRSLSSKRSFESTTETDENGIALSRTPSGRSDASAYSGNASVTSFSSTSSSATTPRRMIPLYNLQAHNVLTNTIVDAGTDAKVAKFQKRGLEIVGLAVLEPIEVWPGASYESASSNLQRPSSFLIPNDQQHTPTSSAVSLASDVPSSHVHDHQHPQPSMMPAPSSTPSPATPQTDRNGPRKFFGKIFNKRKPADSPISPPPPPSIPQNGNGKTSFSGGRPTPIPLNLAQESTPRASKRASLLAAASNLGLTSPSPSLPSSPLPQGHFQQVSSSSVRDAELGVQILGIQSTSLSPVYPPRGKHPQSYSWVLRRWLKGSGDGLLDRLSAQQGIPMGPQCDVRFEWARAKPKTDKARENDRPQTANSSYRGKGGYRNNTGSTVASNTSSLASVGDKAEQRRLSRLSRDVSGSASRARDEDRSVDRDSRRSSSPNPPASIHTHTTTTSTDEASVQPGRRRPSSRGGRQVGDDFDSGDESDPEDSDTPWTCNLIIRQNPGSSLSPQGAQVHDLSEPREIRVQVGAIVPTPHHPKIVSQVKIPFPLPDIDLDPPAVRKRIVTPAGVARRSPGFQSPNSPNSPPSSSFSGSFNKQGGTKPSALTLTAEEIKDIVSCTSLWIIVRQGFGGVGRERRKGDGWRIRG